MVQKFKQLAKKKWFWALVVLVMILGGAGAVFAFRGAPAATITTDVVTRGTLIQTVDATGELESIDKVDLSFENSGTVSVVSYRVGDLVQEGDVIATLRAGETAADVEGARQAVFSARGTLEQRLAGATREDIALAQAQLEVAEAAKNAAQVSYRSALAAEENTKEVQSATLLSATSDLAHAQTDADTDVVQALSDLATAMRGTVITVRSALSEADETLGIDNTFSNNDFERFLSALDSQALTDAQNAYAFAVEARDQAEDPIFAIGSTATATEVSAAADLATTALEHAALTLLYTRRVLDATALDTADFSAEDLSTRKASLDVERDAIQAEQAALVAARQNYENAQSASLHAVEDAQNAFDLAQARYDAELASAAASVASAEATLASRTADMVQAEAALSQVQAGPRRVDLLALEAAVNQAEATLAAAEARFAKSAIVSPISGRLTRMDVKPGEPASPGQVVATVQTTEDRFQIVVKVPESDIAKIALRNTADVTFDAFGEDTHVSGTVEKINPAEEVVEGVVFYEVTVYLGDDGATLDLKPGMSADVTIVTAELPTVLFVPQRAVLERDGISYVRVPEGDQYREQTVKTGLRGDGGRLQITEGLEEGQTVIVSIRE